MSDIKELTKLILKFRDQRQWKHFHTPKDMAISLALEAAEVMEHFQWKNEEEVKKYLKTHKKHIGEELSDVLWWVLLMFHDLELDPVSSFNDKLKKNEIHYPSSKFKGNYKKWRPL